MPDEVSVGELNRVLGRLYTELSGLRQALDRLVRVDVYEAHRHAMTADVRRVERDMDELRAELAERDKQRVQDQAATKRVIWGAALAMVTTIIASVLVQVILK